MKPLKSIQAYPLSWPAGWARTKIPFRTPYKLPLERALSDLTTELRLFHAKDFVVSSNVEPRLAGLPRGAGAVRDAGVAIYWEDHEGRPRVMACDHWDSVRGNVRAITMTINALRQIERSGATQLLERAFTGFAALPAEASPSSWQTVLGLDVRAPTRTEVEVAYRRCALRAHPDQGGSHEALVAVNRARDEALREIASAS